MSCDKLFAITILSLLNIVLVSVTMGLAVMILAGKRSVLRKVGACTFKWVRTLLL